ncbi:MAG: malonyl-CoA decarboxylase [Alphaproteobacteria bacterium]|nr:malonyl-CoA decarboxylase [Alphaproteobacteria bacterium]
MMVPYLGGLLRGILEKGRSLAGLGPDDGPTDSQHLGKQCETLLSSLGEASGMALAERIARQWDRLDEAGRLAFLLELVEHFGPEPSKIDPAVAAYLADPCQKNMLEIHKASEPRRQELLRRMNLAPGGIARLVAMRESLFRHLRTHPQLENLDQDFVHLFMSWFNRGFLVLERIDWNTPASILEKIIRYEAVHAINDWDDLRQRLEPADRRCFAFFHPRLPGDPLIFVEVALTAAIPASIGEVLSNQRSQIDPAQATTAVFYSISNCQEGLRGISFGNFLIKQVVEVLRQESPKLTSFATLSPVPGFAAWLENESLNGRLNENDDAILAGFNENKWQDSPERQGEMRRILLPLAASYFMNARTKSGRIIDPVARFHLSNGARLERLNFMGDPSPKGLSQSYGLMVNYLYKLDDIEANHEAFAARDEVVADQDIVKLARTALANARSK